MQQIGSLKGRLDSLKGDIIIRGVSFDVDSFSHLDEPVVDLENENDQNTYFSNTEDSEDGEISIDDETPVLRAGTNSSDSSNIHHRSDSSDGDNSKDIDDRRDSYSSTRSEMSDSEPPEKGRVYGCEEWIFCGFATNLGCALVYFLVGFFETHVMIRHFGKEWYAGVDGFLFFFVPLTIVVSGGQGLFHIARCVCPTKCKPSRRRAVKDGSMCAAALSIPVSLLAVFAFFFAADFLLLSRYVGNKDGDPSPPLNPSSKIKSIQPGRPLVLPPSQYFNLAFQQESSKWLQFSNRTVMAAQCAGHHEYQNIGIAQCICVAPLVLDTKLQSSGCQIVQDKRYWVYKQSARYPWSPPCGHPSTCPSKCKNRPANFTGLGQNNEECVAWYRSPSFVFPEDRKNAGLAVAAAMGNSSVDSKGNGSISNQIVYVQWSEKNAGYREREIQAFLDVFVPYLFITVVITLFPIVAVVCFPKGRPNKAASVMRKRSSLYYHHTGRVHNDIDLAYDRSVQNLFALKQDGNGGAGISSPTSTGSHQTEPQSVESGRTLCSRVCCCCCCKRQCNGLQKAPESRGHGSELNQQFLEGKPGLRSPNMENDENSGSQEHLLLASGSARCICSW